MDAADIEDLFRPLGRVSCKRMFGGKGIYADDLIFALEIDGEIFLKTDDATRPLFEAAGLRPFVYDSSRGRTATSYWLLAPAAFDDESELLKWGRLGIEASRRYTAKKKARPARTAATKARKR